MKKLSIIFMIALILSSCSSAAVEPTIIPTLIVTPTDTPNPTVTPRPTATPMRMIPETIKIIYSEYLPQSQRDRIERVVNIGYWFYVSIGCSAEGFKATFYDGEENYADYSNGAFMVVSLAGVGHDQGNDSFQSISHEMAHTMCQMAFTKNEGIGAVDLRWLTEGVAVYFSAMEQIARHGGYDGEKMSVATWEANSLKALGYCDLSLSVLEPAHADESHSNEFGTVSTGATVFLVRTTPNGITAVINYDTLLATISKEDAFRQAFDKSKEDFYQQYQDECSKGFPTLIQ